MLLCSVQNFKMIGQMQSLFRTEKFGHIRWFTQCVLVLQSETKSKSNQFVFCVSTGIHIINYMYIHYLNRMHSTTLEKPLTKTLSEIFIATKEILLLKYETCFSSIIILKKHMARVGYIIDTQEMSFLIPWVGES